MNSTLSSPSERDIMLPKMHPSTVFGMPLASAPMTLAADTPVGTGCTTSGCIRGSAIDALAHDIRVAVGQDAVYDRSDTSRAANIFDMSGRDADVMTTAECIEELSAIPV